VSDELLEGVVDPVVPELPVEGGVTLDAVLCDVPVDEDGVTVPLPPDGLSCLFTKGVKLLAASALCW
jgi:hypothetical protein